MKVTIEVRDELYRRVKAKSALEGRPVREVAEELFRGYVGDTSSRAPSGGADPGRRLQGEALPSWFGSLREYARHAERKDMESIRDSIARGIAGDRRL